MSEKEIVRILAAARFKPRSDTLDNWEKENPILLSGEPGVVTGLNVDGDNLEDKTEKIKFGDGVTPWNNLGWWKGPSGPKGEKGEKGEKGDKGDTGPQGEAGKDAVTDQSYNPTSENAQSGKAVAEAISKIPTGGGGSADQSYISYKIENGSAIAYVTDKKKISGDIVLPSFVDGCPVSLEYNCFEDCSLITSITFSNNFTQMYYTGQEFKNCTSLKSITLPASLRQVYSSAFENCNSLTKVYYGGTEAQWERVEILGDCALTTATIHYNYAVDELEERLSTKYITFKDIPDMYTFLEIRDNTVIQSSEPITGFRVTSYPIANFICSIIFTLADEGDITITLPESKYIGDVPNFANGETWELNIMNGVVVGGKVE